MLVRIAIFFLLLVASPAYADVASSNTTTARGLAFGCTERVLCSDQTATGDCVSESGDEIVANLGPYSELTFTGLKSSGSYSCDLMYNDQGHDAASGAGHQINTVSVSDEQPSITLSGGHFHYVWATCTEVASSVTMTVLACPGGPR